MAQKQMLHSLKSVDEHADRPPSRDSEFSHYHRRESQGDCFAITSNEEEIRHRDHISENIKVFGRHASLSKVTVASCHGGLLQGKIDLNTSV